jgi:tRNA A-37 threonylcarbamoyl transferase component Bud32
MIDDRAINDIRRELEQAQRDFSRAKNTIAQSRSQLVDFVLANAALIAEGNKLDLSAYEEAIQGAEFDRECAVRSFQEARDRMINLANRLCLFD